MDTFDGLGINPRVRKGVDSAGYRRPFPIQERAIGPLLQGRNLIGQAKAGSGKTLAFGIPLVQSVDEKDFHVQCLVLAPTRELAVQITIELEKIAAYTGVRVLAIYGGQSMNPQLEALRRGVQIVVGTPGRVIDHLERGTLRLEKVRFVVLDEADTMLDMGFLEDVDFILQRAGSKNQMALFSATMPGSIVELSQRYMADPVKVIVDEYQPTAQMLEQYYARVPREQKLDLLLKILGEEAKGSAVIFCRTKHRTYQLAKDLERRFLKVVSLHGDLTQNQRDNAMRSFRSGSAEILVATDVASRGIDVRQVDCVVNFDVPEDPVVYFHRVGRTARAGDPGKAFTLVSPDESLDFDRILSRSGGNIRPMRPEDVVRPRTRRTVGEGEEFHRRRPGMEGRWGGRKKWRRYR